MHSHIPEDRVISHGYCPDCYLQTIEEIEECGIIKHVS